MPKLVPFRTVLVRTGPKPHGLTRALFLACSPCTGTVVHVIDNHFYPARYTNRSQAPHQLLTKMRSRRVKVKELVIEVLSEKVRGI